MRRSIPLLGTLFVVGWMGTVVSAAPSGSVKDRLDSVENALASILQHQVGARPDGVVPERTQVYSTSADCSGIKKTKLYFDGTHPFHVLGEQKCGNQVFLVIRWYEKDFSNEISINTVLKSDVILTPK